MAATETKTHGQMAFEAYTKAMKQARWCTDLSQEERRAWSEAGKAAANRAANRVRSKLNRKVRKLEEDASDSDWVNHNQSLRVLTINDVADRFGKLMEAAGFL